MTTTTLSGPLEQTRGIIGRYPAPGERYVFGFDRVKPRTIHMVGVRRPLRVEWWADGELKATETLRPWTGLGRHRADHVIERRPLHE